MQPEIRYAQSSGAAIAYQVIGNADTDLVFSVQDDLLREPPDRRGDVLHLDLASVPRAPRTPRARVF